MGVGVGSGVGVRVGLGVGAGDGVTVGLGEAVGVGVSTVGTAEIVFIPNTDACVGRMFCLTEAGSMINVIPNPIPNRKY